MLRHLPTLVAVSLALATLIALAAPLGWPFELAGHFKPHLTAIAAVSAVATVALFFRRRTRRAVIAPAVLALCAILNGAALFFPGPFATPEGGDGEVRLVWANLHRSEAALARLAERTQADVVVLTELPFGELDRMAAFYPEHPHRLMVGRPGVWGTRDVAVLSRYPVRDEPELTAQLARRLALAATIEAPTPFVLFASHPYPPGTPRHFRLRNHIMEVIGGAASGLDGPFIVAGDFNATPWTPGYHALPGRRAGDPRRAATWAARHPLIGLPIDHVMLSDTVRLHRYEVLPDIGSDHFPVYAEVSIDPR